MLVLGTPTSPPMWFLLSLLQTGPRWVFHRQHTEKGSVWEYPHPGHFNPFSTINSLICPSATAFSAGTMTSYQTTGVFLTLVSMLSVEFNMWSLQEWWEWVLEGLNGYHGRDVGFLLWSLSYWWPSLPSPQGKSAWSPDRRSQRPATEKTLSWKFPSNAWNL